MLCVCNRSANPSWQDFLRQDNARLRRHDILHDGKVEARRRLVWIRRTAAAAERRPPPPFAAPERLSPKLAVYQGGYCGRIVVLCLPEACLREKHPTADAASTGLNRLLLPLLPRKPLRCAQPTTQDKGQRAEGRGQIDLSVRGGFSYQASAIKLQLSGFSYQASAIGFRQSG